MDQKIILILAALLVALVTLVAPASADVYDDARVDANASYHAMLTPVVPEAANLMTWPYGSRMFDKWCGLPNMVMSYNGMDYDQMLQAFTGAQGDMMASMMDPTNPSLHKFTMYDNTTVWNASATHLNKTLLDPYNLDSSGHDVTIYTADMAEWMEDGSCGDCHIGGGGLAGQTEADVKCGNCHLSVEGTSNGFNGNTDNPTAEVNAKGFLGDTSCETAESCHAHDAPKHDMSFTAQHDVHAGSAEFSQIATDAGYGDNTCLNCHQPGVLGNNHNFGRPNNPDTAFDLTTISTMKECDNVDCHGANGGVHTNAVLNQHTGKLECFVCHTSKETIGEAYSLDDWTIVGSHKENDVHDMVYYWAGPKTGGDFGPNINTLNGVDTDYIVYPFIGDSMKAYAGMWPFPDTNPNTFPDTDDVKIRPSEVFMMKLWVYMDMGAAANGNPLWASMMGIDKDLLWAMDQAGNKDGIVSMDELVAAGYVPINVNENGMPIDMAKPAFTPFEFIAYPKMGIHNVNRGGSLAAPYTCNDCHSTNGAILDFENLGIGYLVDFFDNTTGTVGINNSVHASILPNGTVVTPNDCTMCHGEYVPHASNTGMPINTTIVTGSGEESDSPVEDIPEEDTPEEAPQGTPGFEAVLAVTGLLGAVLLARRD